MTELTLSIVIINYNYGRFLGEAIASALAVDATDKEVIVIDDGSTDDSESVLRKFGGRIRTIFKMNGGPISAVNEGFRHTRGDVIIFLDADDRIDREVAQRVFAVWDQTVAKVQYLANVIDQNGKQVGRIQPNFTKIPAEKDILRSLISSTTYVTSPGSGNAYARWFLRDLLPLPETLQAYQDDLMNAAAPLYGRVLSLLTPLFDYRHHGANSAAQDSLDISKLVRLVHADRGRLEFIREQASRRGLSIAADAIFNSPYHVVACLAIRKHTPRLLPYDFSVGRLAALGLSAIVRYRSIGMREKLVLSLWMLSVALTPRAIAVKLIAFRYVPKSRPKWASAILTRLRVRGADKPPLRSLPSNSRL